MSFYATLKFYRPTPPPRIVAGDLSRFVARIRDTGTLTDSGLQLVQVKFGPSIDMNDKATHWLEETVPGISNVCDIEWDIDEQYDGLQKTVDALAGDSRTVYRAEVMLGTPTEQVVRPITRTNSPENEIDFQPDTLSIEVGPIEISSFEQPLHAGWVSVRIGGGGYLFPWTLSHIVRRLESTTEIARIAEVCRSFWSVEPAPPALRIVNLRKQFENLWPYPEFEKPWDWFWGVAEG